jgi:hypothetical protein
MRQLDSYAAKLPRNPCKDKPHASPIPSPTTNNPLEQTQRGCGNECRVVGLTGCIGVRCTQRNRARSNNMGGYLASPAHSPDIKRCIVITSSNHGAGNSSRRVRRAHDAQPCAHAEHA